MSLRLFHVSSEPDIVRFDPRPSPARSGVTGNAVWAIAESHIPNYLVPRDCPRVTYVCDETTTPEDRDLFFGCSAARRIIAIEPRWLKRALAEPIYLYEMPATDFICVDRHAGHHVSRTPVTPLSVTKIDAPLEEMLEHDVELRVVRDLVGLQARVMQSTLSFSTTRLRNATGYRPEALIAGTTGGIP